MTEPIRGLTEIIDPTYRYNMETMEVVKERTKVCIINIDQIARRLGLPNKEPLVAYIEKRLSAKTKIEQVKTRGETCDRVILANNMNLNAIRQTIYPFIEAFVLCPTCRLPELKYSIKKSSLYGECMACPFYGEIEGDKYGSTTIKKFNQILGTTGKKKNRAKASKSGKASKTEKSKTKKSKIKKSETKEDNSETDGRSRLDILLAREAQEQNEINGFS